MPILDWMTRGDDVRAAATVPYRLLEAVPALDGGDATTGNMLIQGDNLDALKALLPYYKGEVKCAYIDPPFGTGKEFENYDDLLKHSQWLEMFYPRASILHQLLKNDGALFVHLDENEIDYAKVCLDEIFGRNNFVSRVTLKARSPSAFSTVNPGVFKAAEYILWYAKNKSSMPLQRVWTARDPDTAYKKWIANPTAHHSLWSIESATPIISTFLREESGRLTPAKALKKFYVKNAGNLVRLAEIDDEGAGQDIVQVKMRSLESPAEILRIDREGFDPVFITSGQQILFYSKNIQLIDGELTPAKMLTNIWEDISWEGISGEGQVKLKKGKKPERLIRRCFQLVTQSGDLVLDSFLGSGTTVAVAHKRGLRWIGIERGPQAITHAKQRLDAVIAGETSGVSKIEGWTGGGGYRFYRLGVPVFDANGHIADGIRFATLAAHIWFSETGMPFTGAANTPVLGVHNGIAYALLYNGILGDRAVSGGNVLTAALLARLRVESKWDGPITIYGEWSKLGAARLAEAGVTFKQTPYDVRAN